MVATMLAKLSKDDRMRLMRFVCSFAWADLEIREKERDFIKKLQKKVGLSTDEIAEVEKWLEVPPRPEDVDPAKVPKAHRQMFLEAAKGMIAADGEIDEAEAENFELLEQLLR